MNSISTRRRLAALLLLPFLMVLAGCGKLHAEFDIQDVDTINVSYDFAIDSEYTAGVWDSAEDMCSDLEGEMTVVGEMAPTVEPYEADDQLGCRITGVMTSDNFGDGFTLTEEDGEFHLVISSDGAGTDDITGGGIVDLDFQMVFTFPGAVTDASGGEIDGNTVTFSDFDEFSDNGIDIRADANGFPWVIVLIAVLVLGFLLLLVLAAVVFFVLRNRRTTGGGSGPTGGVPGGYAGASAAAAPQGSQQWGQASPPPAAPQQGGQQWGQASPPPAAPPQGGPQWGQASPPPAAPPQGGQPWGQPPQDGQQNQAGNPWDHPGDGQRPPQNPGS